MLKTSLIDFYSSDVLLAAKQQLLQDINKVNGGLVLPHIPHQRQGLNRAARSVDDMFTLMTVLDENKALDMLPKYVASGPDSMPSTRLYEGDFGVLLATIEKMSGRLDTFGSALSAISRDVYALQSKCKSSAGQSTGGQGVINSGTTDMLSLDNIQQWPMLPVRHEPDAGSSQAQSGMTSRGDPIGNAVSTSAKSTVPTTTDGAMSDVAGPLLRTGSQWSTLMSTPVVSSNRFAALATTDDVDSDNDGRPFTTVQSQKQIRASAKRQREQSYVPVVQQSSRQPEREANHGPDGESSRPSGKQRKQVTGRSSDVLLPIWAAKKTAKKSVFCVDNVDLNFNEDDIRAFVVSLGVEVFTCFKTNPKATSW